METCYPHLAVPEVSQREPEVLEELAAEEGAKTGLEVTEPPVEVAEEENLVGILEPMAVMAAPMAAAVAAVGSHIRRLREFKPDAAAMVVPMAAVAARVLLEKMQQQQQAVLVEHMVVRAETPLITGPLEMALPAQIPRISILSIPDLDLAEPWEA